MTTRTSDSKKAVWLALRGLAKGREHGGAVLPLMDSCPSLVIASALSQKCGAALADVLHSAGLRIPNDLREEVERARFKIAVSKDVLARIDVALGSAGIPWVALKGAVVASMYQNPSVRTFNDIDILVNGSDMRAAIDTLHGSGIEDINRNWGNYLRHGVAETPLWGPGIAVDLHWHVIGLARDRRGIAIDIPGMIDRRRRTPAGPVGSLGAGGVWTVDPEDLILHVCIHAAMSGATKLVWLRDVRELVRARPVDWGVLVARAASTGMGAKIGQVLDRARCVVDAAVPPQVPRQLCPDLLLRARAWIDHHDLGRGVPDRYLRGLPIEVSNQTISASPGALRAAVRKRSRGEPGWNVGEPASLLYWARASGGAQGRQRYLSYAAGASDRWH